MDGRELDLKFLARWLGDQQFIFKVSRHIEKPRPDVADQDRLFSYLWPKGPDVPDAADAANYRKRLTELPPVALELICSLNESHVFAWEDHLSIWRDELARLKWDPRPKQKVSRLAGAKLLANRISTGWLSPARLCRIAWLEMRADDWETIPSIGKRLARLGEAFAGIASAYQKLDALADFRAERVPSGWALVENALLQDLFSWPLLVPDNNQISYALPAIVDVQLGVGGNSDQRLTQIICGSHVDADDWHEHLEKSRDAAIKLWETKRGVLDDNFRKLVNEAHVTLDLRLASEIVKAANQKVEVAHGSLGAYIATEILSSILGQSSAGRVAATGVLTDFKKNGYGEYGSDGGDHEVAPVGDSDSWILSKIRCADRSFYFDKIIVPKGSIGFIEAHRDNFDLEVIEGYDPDAFYGLYEVNNGRFSEYAKHALGQIWRNHRYVRCPDIEATFKSEKALRYEHPLARQSNISKEILRNIRPWYRPIIDFGARYTGADIARVLYWKLRKAERDSNWSEIKKDKRRGNFAFIRATHNEQNERFWATVWDACGGDARGFHRFVLSKDVPEAAKELAALLNNVAPSDAHRARAPDVLVIIGANRLILNDDFSQRGRADNQFGLSGLLRELSVPDILVRCPNPVLRTQLLGCRIILVDEKDVASHPLQIHLLPPELRKPAVDLSIFRRGFSLSVAQSMLGLGREVTRKVLDQLIQVGELLSYSESTGEYWVKYKADIRDQHAEYDLHIRAADSIVGILDRADRPEHEDFSNSLKPENLHEAQWHVNEAFQLSQRFRPLERSAQKRTAARSRRERLSRIGEPFTWSQLAWNMRYSYEAGEEVWSEACSAIGRMGIKNVDIKHLINVAQFANKLSKSTISRKDFFESACRGLISYTLRRISKLPAKRANSLRFTILTLRAWVTMKSSPDESGAASAAEDNSLAWQCLPAAEEILQPEWFEQYGDAIDDHREALDRYGEGFLNRSIAGATGLSLTTMLKWLGCLYLTGQKPNVNQRRAIAVELDDQKWNTVKEWASTGKPPHIGLHRRFVSAKRLGAGVKVITSRGFFDA